MPIALDTMERKLKRGEFPTMTTLESYFKRMVSNAKEYNEKGSEIHDDAERLRKAMNTFMVANNPAYKTDPDYVAFPTPLPAEDEDAEGSEEDAEGEEDVEVTGPSTKIVIPSKRRPGRPPKDPVAFELARQRRLSSTPARSESAPATSSNGFSGLTFQQAQEKIISDMLTHKEDEE